MSLNECPSSSLSSSPLSSMVVTSSTTARSSLCTSWGAEPLQHSPLHLNNSPHVTLACLQLHLRLLQGFWLQQPQDVTFSKLSGAIGVVESRNTGSTVLLVLSLTHPNCSTSSGTMSRLKFVQMLA